MPNDHLVPSFSRGVAKQAIERLSNGVAVSDPDALRFLNVGQERWHDAMRTLLGDVRDFDVSTVRIVSAYYGAGKSHFLTLVASEALARNFVVAKVDARHVPLHKFEEVWKGVLRGIETRGDKGEPDGIRGMLDAWCDVSSNRVPEALVALDQVRGLDPSFRVALRLYLQAYLDDGDRGVIEQWLLGGPTRPKGVTNKVDKSTAHVMLRSLTKFIKHAGYSGLVLVFDELEDISKQTAKIRRNSYEAVRQFVDSASEPESLLFLGACIPNMLSDTERGFASYPALQQRLGLVRLVEASTIQDFHGTVVNLDGSPLSSDDLTSLGLKLRAVHSLAWDWDASAHISNTFIAHVVTRVLENNFGVAAVRLLVQFFMNTLELSRQNPELDVARTIDADLNKAAAHLIREKESMVATPWE